MTDDLPRGRGWCSIPVVELDGQNWPLEFASRMLHVPLDDLQQQVKVAKLKPSGVINMRSYKSQGRVPRVYPAEKLIRICETIEALRESL
jgi:hypothetical protein